jgi:hypothetical protein
MAAVYRAHDAKLGLDVGIETLPEAFASDPRSAPAPSASGGPGRVKPPNIAHIYDLEESRTRRIGLCNGNRHIGL